MFGILPLQEVRECRFSELATGSRALGLMQLPLDLHQSRAPYDPSEASLRGCPRDQPACPNDRRETSLPKSNRSGARWAVSPLKR